MHGLLIICSIVGLWSLSLGVKGREFVDGRKWVSTEDLDEYLVDNTYYIDFGETDAIKVLEELKRYGTIESYEKPLDDEEIPYYRVVFTATDPAEISRLLTIMHYNNTIQDQEQVPMYKIQQGPTKQDKEPKNMISSTRYFHELGVTTEKLGCLSFTNDKVKVAVVDNGFFTTHPNIMRSILTMYDIADDDPIVIPPKESKDRSHGTMAAGLIAGIPDNQEGIIGTALGNAELILIKSASNKDKPFDISHGIEGIKTAIDLGADIIVLSWGAPQDSKVMRKVLEKAKEKNVRIIAAAGNQNVSTPFYPAAYEEVIAIGSYDTMGKKAWFSNYGNRVQYMVPGTDIPVPGMKKAYFIDEGTSFSAPIYAGIYALLYRLLQDHEQIPELLQNEDKRVVNIPTVLTPQICLPQEEEEEPHKTQSYSDSGGFCPERIVQSGKTCESLSLNTALFDTVRSGTSDADLSQDYTTQSLENSTILKKQYGQLLALLLIGGGCMRIWLKRLIKLL